LRDISKTSRELGVFSWKTVGPEFISKLLKIARQLGEEESSSQAGSTANRGACEKKRSESSWLTVKIFDVFLK
jgi:hypothetical protein